MPERRSLHNLPPESVAAHPTPRRAFLAIRSHRCRCMSHSPSLTVTNSTYSITLNEEQLDGVTRREGARAGRAGGPGTQGGAWHGFGGWSLRLAAQASTPWAQWRSASVISACFLSHHPPALLTQHSPTTERLPRGRRRAPPRPQTTLMRDVVAAAAWRPSAYGWRLGVQPHGRVRRWSHRNHAREMTITATSAYIGGGNEDVELLEHALGMHMGWE